MSETGYHKAKDDYCRCKQFDSTIHSVRPSAFSDASSVHILIDDMSLSRVDKGLQDDIHLDVKIEQPSTFGGYNRSRSANRGTKSVTQEIKPTILLPTSFSGTIGEPQPSSWCTRPSTEPACESKFKYYSDNIPSNHQSKGARTSREGTMLLL